MHLKPKPACHQLYIIKLELRGCIARGIIQAEWSTKQADSGSVGGSLLQAVQSLLAKKTVHASMLCSSFDHTTKTKWFPLSHLWPCWQLQIKKLTEQAHVKASLGFQLGGKSLQLKLRNTVHTFSQNSEFFPPFGLCMAFLPSRSQCLPSFVGCDQNRNFTAENCELNTVRDLSLYAGTSCHKEEKYQETSVSAGTKRLPSSPLYGFPPNSHLQLYHFSWMVFATAS